MHSSRRRFTPLAACTLMIAAVTHVSAAPPSPRIGFPRPPRKVIAYGWELGFLEIEAISRRAAVMQRQPFDGIMFSLVHKGVGRDEAFIHSTRLSDEQFSAHRKILSGIRWTTFTDNFLVIKAGERYLDDGEPPRMDWFDDAQWNAICHNVGVLTRVAKSAGCIGLAFDPEPYHSSTWNYQTVGSRKAQPRHATHSFAQYRQIVRQRGAQYMRAIQENIPDVRIFNLYQAVRLPPSELAESIYSLYPAFINGMLDAALPGVRLIDGNEYGFSLLTKADFTNAYVNVKERKQVLIDPRNREKYRRQVEVSVPIYLDDIVSTHRHRRWIGTYLSADDRRQLLEHKLYHALDSVDRYVWVYSERCSWFGSPPRVPRYAAESIRRARKSAESLRLQKRPTHDALIDRVRQGMARRTRELDGLTRSEHSRPRLKLPTAKVPAINPSIAVPALDGELSDEAWKHAAVLEDFRPLLYLVRDRSLVETRCLVTWTPGHLYLAAVCQEPRLADVQKASPSEQHRNRITLILGQSPDRKRFTRIDLPWRSSPRRMTRTPGKPWTAEAIEQGSIRVAFGGGKQQWSLEARIAWTALGGPPKVGTNRAASVSRIRSPFIEHDSWGPQIDPNLIDDQLLGTWTLTGD